MFRSGESNECDFPCYGAIFKIEEIETKKRCEPTCHLTPSAPQDAPSHWAFEMSHLTH